LPEKKLIKEKLASLVVAIALRTWPQQWPDFREFLRSLFHAKNLVSTERALYIVRTFAEDVFIFDTPHLEDARLHELKMALISEAPAFLGLVSDYLKSLTGSFSATSVDPVQGLTQETLLIEAIHVWTAYAEWIPFQYTC
jgi:hypothetical protein